MNEKDLRKPSGHKTGNITVRVIDEKKGLQVLKNVKAVRVHSKDYVLLILEDYSPTIGEIEGDVFFLTEDREVIYKDISGCYKHQNNEFTLIVSEEK